MIRSIRRAIIDLCTETVLFYFLTMNRYIYAALLPCFIFIILVW